MSAPKQTAVPPVVGIAGGLVALLGLLVTVCAAAASNAGIVLVGLSGVIFGGAGLVAQRLPERGRGRASVLGIGVAVAGVAIGATGALTDEPIRVLVGCNLLVGAMGMLLIPHDAKPAFAWAVPALIVAFPVSMFIAGRSERARRHCLDRSMCGPGVVVPRYGAPTAVGSGVTLTVALAPPAESKTSDDIPSQSPRHIDTMWTSCLDR